MELGEEVGDSRTEESAAIGDGGQAAISLTLDAGGTGSDSLLDLILSTLLNEMMWGLGSSYFFLIQMTLVPLDCFVNGCCNLCIAFYVQGLCLKS